MNVFDTIIAVFWLIFLGCWLISAPGAKRNRQGIAWSREAALRVAIVIAVILLLKSPLRQYVTDASNPISNPVVESIGVALCAIGIAFAIWARLSLGRNWGFPMTLKADPELVSNGPYALVRHPIYAGILLAVVGTALVIGPVWLLVVVIVCAYFLYAAAQEERLLTEAFPLEYPAYKRRTKMLIPFII